MTVWFTSDQHFGHSSILSFTGRPCTSLHEMHRMMIEGWQKRVKRGDLVYVLGDFIWKARPEHILSQLPGNLYFVKGNHDHKKVYNNDRWIWAKDLTHISINGQSIVLCHYPLHQWRKSHWGAWHFHGHSHATIPPHPDKPRRADIGVDTHPELAPWSFEEMEEAFDSYGWLPPDESRKSPRQEPHPSPNTGDLDR